MKSLWIMTSLSTRQQDVWISRHLSFDSREISRQKSYKNRYATLIQTDRQYENITFPLDRR